jgi:large subunit ribosomal protein L7/L12
MEDKFGVSAAAPIAVAAAPAAAAPAEERNQCSTLFLKKLVQTKLQ